EPRRRQDVEMTSTGQPDLRAQPEAFRERKPVLDQSDGIPILRDEGQTNVVREVITRIEPEHHHAGSKARTISPKREDLLVRSVGRDREIDDLEPSTRHEALQLSTENRTERLFVADLEPFRLAVADEQDASRLRRRDGLGNRAAETPRVVRHIDGVLALPGVTESGARAIDEIEL